VVTCEKTAEPIVMPFELSARFGSRNHELDMGVHIPHEKGQCWGKGLPMVKYRDFLPWAVQKRLIRSICRLGCGLGWAEGSTSSIVFARWRQCALPMWAHCRHLTNTIEPSVCGGDAVSCQITLTTCFKFHARIYPTARSSTRLAYTAAAAASLPPTATSHVTV